MSARKTVWVVEQGSHSDYRVLAVCDSKERAEAAAAAVNAADRYSYNDASIAALPYIDSPTESVTTYTIQCAVWDDETASEQRESERTENEIDALYPERIVSVGYRWVRAPVHNDRGGRLEVYGTDQERVRKVFSDKRAELLCDPVLRSRREFRR